MNCLNGRMRRRLEALERSRPLQRYPDQHQEILTRTIQQLSTEDLRLVRDLIAQGRWEGELTEEESAAARLFTSLFEQEAQRAGYSSMAEFQRSCRSGS
jgi:hypothetical protein